MSADKRTVTTDALQTLGTIITENEKRDAIHLAVENVVAKQALYPGQHVGADGTTNNPVGIVDPFIRGRVLPGQRFWLVVYPRVITSLRHVWTHPAFPDEIITTSMSREDAIQKLTQIVEGWDGPNYETFMELAKNGSVNDEDGHYSINGEYIYSYGRDAYGAIPPEVWDLYKIITGEEPAGRPTDFTCSC